MLATFFAFTFRKDIFKVFDEPIYSILALLAFGAVAVRVLAFLKRRNVPVAIPY